MKHSKPKFTVFKRKRANGKRDKEYTIEYLTWKLKIKRFKSHFTDKQLARVEALRLATIAHEIRVGIRKPPSPADEANFKDLSDHVDDYMEWGKNHGGKKNKGWDEVHVRKMRAHLDWWLEKTKWVIFLDINVSEAEKVLTEKSKETYEIKKNGEMVLRKIAGKTVEHYRNDFKSFVNWYRRTYKVYDNPLEGLMGWDVSVQDPRRAMSSDELGRLIAFSPFDRGTVYWTAAITGLRRGELELLKNDSYDFENSLLHLTSDMDKEREACIIYLPMSLNRRLKEYVRRRGEYSRLFRFDFQHAIRLFDQDCRNAKIEKRTKDGKLVFHSLRDTQINLGIDSGLDLKTGMELSRHKTVKIYLEKYAKRKNIKIIKAVDDIGKTVENSVRKFSNLKI